MPSLPADGNPDPGAGDFGEDAGYRKGLKARQVQMIGIGGAIGSGLFLGAGGRLAKGGPGCSWCTPCAGSSSFSSCGRWASWSCIARRRARSCRTRANSSAKAAYAIGWMYFLGWSMTAIVDTTAIATYLRRWTTFESIPSGCWRCSPLSSCCR